MVKAKMIDVVTIDNSCKKAKRDRREWAVLNIAAWVLLVTGILLTTVSLWAGATEVICGALFLKALGRKEK